MMELLYLNPYFPFLGGSEARDICDGTPLLFMMELLYFNPYFPFLGGSETRDICDGTKPLQPHERASANLV